MKDNNEILKWDYLNVFFELLWGWVGIGNGELNLSYLLMFNFKYFNRKGFFCCSDWFSLCITQYFDKACSIV